MTSRRVLKVAEAIREVVSWAILTELRDPRVQNVTVTHVEVSADLQVAKVNISVMGDEKKEALTLHGLESAVGFLQRKVADRLATRYVPKLKFYIDKGVKHSLEISRILDEVLPKKAKVESAEEYVDSVEGVDEDLSRVDGEPDSNEATQQNDAAK